MSETKPKRPTAAQLDVLRKMSDGWRLYGTPNVTRFREAWAERTGEKNARVLLKTFDVILSAGLIAQGLRHSRFSGVYHFTLTDAGRAAIKEWEG